MSLVSKLKHRKRVGRGAATHHGRRCGRGNKGAKARSRGLTKALVQSGGQNPFYRMHGKIGFRSPKAKTRVKAINAAWFAGGKEVPDSAWLDRHYAGAASGSIKVIGWRDSVVDLSGLRGDPRVFFSSDAEGRSG